MLPGPTCVVFVYPCLAKGGANTGLAMAQEEFEAWRLGAYKTLASSPGLPWLRVWC